MYYSINTKDAKVEVTQINNNKIVPNGTEVNSELKNLF